jgi:hypothetical protein
MQFDATYLEWIPSFEQLVTALDSHYAMDLRAASVAMTRQAENGEWYLLVDVRHSHEGTGPQKYVALRAPDDARCIGMERCLNQLLLQRHAAVHPECASFPLPAKAASK